jgi:hypothetical protein
MPVSIRAFEPFSDDAFDELKERKRRKAGTPDPGMVALLQAVAAGQPQRVPLAEGQSARGVRVAIARAAARRGLAVATAEGEGFVAVMRVDGHRTGT